MNNDKNNAKTNDKNNAKTNDKNNDKTLLITGASSEVGMSLVGRIYKDYKTIYLHYSHMKDDFKKVIDDIGDKTDVRLIQADFSSEESTESMVKVFSKEGVFPNNIVHLSAPPLHNKQFHKENWAYFEAGWNISVRSITMILKELMKPMSRLNYGRIVFMLTSNTIGLPTKYQSAYVTYKYALLGLMKSLSIEYADKGITVNAISPDMMETKFLSEIPDKIIELNAMNSPMGRNIRVEEVVPVIEHFLSDDAGAITGQNVGITGGL